MGSIDHSNGAGGHFDVVVVGGGFGGCYSLYKLRKAGYSTHLIEAGSGLGGVWHWNSYPGARVDSEIPYYQYSIPEVYRSWTWTQRFPDHAELKAYFRHVDKVLNLSKDISYTTIVTGADFDEASGRWTLQTNTGKVFTCKYFIAATGSSYKRYEPDFPEMKNYKGKLIHAASWPESGIDLAGKNVAVIGAGATGLQCVQEVSKVAKKLTSYIRNPIVAIPMGQRPLSELENNAQKGIYKGLFQLARQSAAGIACDAQPKRASQFSKEEQQEYLKELWARGGFGFQAANFADFLVDMEVNKLAYQFWLKKTRERIRDPAKADIVAPLEQPYPVATKRCSLEQDYYESLDRDNVEVVSLKTTPVRRFTETGIITEDGKEREHDYVILATGYDNMTRSLTGMGLRGKDGVDMKERWKNGVWTYLGIMAKGNPNMFMIYGPQAPTAFTNAPVFIETQVEFVIDLMNRLRDQKIKSIEPKHSAEQQWKGVLQELNDASLFPLNKSCSWYLGANIPGKKQEPLNYIGGIGLYGKSCEEGTKDWSNFEIVKEKGAKATATEPVKAGLEQVVAF